MLKTKVKASSITNLTDARYFAAREVTWLGFDLTPGSERQVSPAFVNAIREWVDGVQIIGEFSMATEEEIRLAVEAMNLDGVQVGMFTGIPEVRALSGIPVFKEIVVEPALTEPELSQTLDAFAPHCEAFLINFDKNRLSFDDVKAGKTFSPAVLSRLCQAYPILLSIEFEPTQLNEMLDTLNPAGINVMGGEEEKTGFKSFDDLDEIFESLEVYV